MYSPLLSPPEWLIRVRFLTLTPEHSNPKEYNQTEESNKQKGLMPTCHKTSIDFVFNDPNPAPFIPGKDSIPEI